MNVYAVAGRTKGKSVSKIDVGSTNSFVNNIIKGIGDMDGLDFILKFKGTTYGLGTTFAGGISMIVGLFGRKILLIFKDSPPKVMDLTSISCRICM